MTPGVINATPVAIWVVTTLPAVPPVRKQKSIAFSMLLPIRNAALVSMGAPGLVLVDIREKVKSQGDRPSMVDIWRLGEPLSESNSDVIDVESTG